MEECAEMGQILRNDGPAAAVSCAEAADQPVLFRRRSTEALDTMEDERNDGNGCGSQLFYEPQSIRCNEAG